MKITGEALIGAASVRCTGEAFQSFSPATGEYLQPLFHTAGQAEIARAAALAQAAFDGYRETGHEQRARFLETIAEQILALGDELILRAMAETGLPRARLEGERGRTVGQLQLFAGVLREGSWLDARLDTALPERAMPRPSIRMRMIALGPVAVFGASNFPLAFSVAGGDTASALAAGCPVIVKAHPAHPGTSELVGRAVQKAVALCQLDEGVFSMLTGIGNALGADLVRHPVIQAVGFTGSRQGGLALMAVAAGRPQPIPVYAEMSSINPVFLLPQALASRGEAIAAGFAASLTLGTGQFCTNPGLVLGIKGQDFESFAEQAARALSTMPAGTMLTPGIQAAYQRGVDGLAKHPKVETLGAGAAGNGVCQGVPALFSTNAASFLAEHALSDEVFGPSSLLVACNDAAEMRQLAEQLEGQLTATLQMDDGDTELALGLMPILERKAGRILVNGFSTGVEVSTAMVHGGPFPATSDSKSTSVGSAAIHRFLRPVSYQNMPQALLPVALRDGNPLQIWRRKDGQLGRD
ncbi:MAG: aldehyde dehydrogenase (NADP(+)) [Pseudomonadota bacterium]